MSYLMTGKMLADKCVDISKNYKTLYVMGCFGAPMNARNKARYSNNCDYNRQASRKEMIMAASADTFGFDCVNLIKGILWGWCGDSNATYGGATYASYGVPDTNANGMIQLCSGVSTDFSKMSIGEALWIDGHIGVYIGNGLAVECTPKWKNKVQITAVGNMGTVAGYNTRTWTKHGKLPWIDYILQEEITMQISVAELEKMIYDRAYDIAKEMIDDSLGPWISTINDIPHESVKKEVRRLLDCGAINGGTTYEDNPDDINLPYNEVRVLVMSARYTDKKT